MAIKKGPKKPGRKAAEPTLYPNSPLAEVVFEIRFPGEPAVECRRDEYFALIREEFSTVWVPSVEPGKPPAMLPYHFKSQDDSETIMVAINRFAYSTKCYGGFNAFQPRVVTLAQRFCRLYGIKKLNRTGLRYVNVIPFVRESGLIPWDQYFTIAMKLPADSSDHLMNINLAFEVRHEVGAITTRIACVRSESGEEAFLLDFDFAKTEGISAPVLSKILRESHDHTKRVFGEILSEHYKAVMRGEAIE